MVGYGAFFPLSKESQRSARIPRTADRQRPVPASPLGAQGRDRPGPPRRRPGGPRSLPDRLTFKLYDTLEAGYAGFEAERRPDGQHSRRQLRRARAAFPGHVFEQASNSFSYLGVPLYRPEFADRRIRQALSLAIDRQAIIDTVTPRAVPRRRQRDQPELPRVPQGRPPVLTPRRAACPRAACRRRRLAGKPAR